MKNLLQGVFMAVLAVGCSYCNADIVSFDFGPTLAAATTTATTTDPNVTSTAITNGGTGNFTTTLPDYGQPVLQVNPPNNDTNDAAEAIANNSFFSFTVTPDSGFLLDLTRLDLSAARGGASTARGFEVRSSLDGFSTSLGGDPTIDTVRTTLTDYSIDLTAPAFDAVAGPIEFRVYTFSPVAGNSVEYDDISLLGEVASVPEPSSGIFALAALGCLLRRRKTGLSH